MAESKCFSLIRGRVMRVTKLDACGAPVPGADSAVVTEGFITVGLTPTIDEGTEISVTNAAGKICVSDIPCPVFQNYTIEIALCGVHPDLLAIMTGAPSVTDGEGAKVGVRINSGTSACDSGFALEVWSNVPAGVCDPNAGQSFGYFLVPFVQPGTIGDLSIGNDAVNFTVTGARSKDGSAWAEGPYDVVMDSTPAPSGLLEPVDDQDHLIIELTTVPPPEPSECATVPVGDKATTVTAGAPGSFGPAGSYPPADLATLNADPDIGQAGTSRPSADWTAGQFVVLGDASEAHWMMATSWTAGKVPGTPPVTPPAITGVTAGTPGTFDPAGSTPPADLAALKADPTVGDTGTAKPTTAWTTGQFVDLGDASDASWDGTAWEVGAQP